jgi:transcriptional regulator with XRE-family HTH domain
MSFISVEQIKAARMLLKWDQATLAKKADIGIVTIKRIEAAAGQPKATVRILNKIKNALETAGIEFLGSVEENPGIRLNNKKI